MNTNLISETSQPKRPHYPLVLHSKTPPPVSYVDIDRGTLPGRGLLYSFLLHEIAIFAILLLPLTFRPVRQFRVEKGWRRIDTKLTYLLPSLGGGHEGGGRPARKSGAAPAKPVKRRAAPAESPKGARGLVYPAPQPVVSNPPNPTNRIQTILQPELPKPPSLKVPIPLPNMVTLARSTRTPAPPPLVPKVNLKPTSVVPPAAPKLETSTPVMASPIPVPPPPPADVVPKLRVPAPPPEAAPPSLESEQWQVAQIPQLSQTETMPPPQAPNLSLPSGAGGTDERTLLVLSPTPGPPEEATKVPPGEARGQFAMGPEPNLTAEAGAEVGTGTGAGSGPGTGASTGTGAEGGVPGGGGLGSAGGIAGSGTGEGLGTGTEVGNGAGTGSGSGSGTGGIGTGTGTGIGAGTGSGRGVGEGTGTGSGTGAGSGPGTGPFPGISIVGGGTNKIVGPQPSSSGTAKPSVRPTYGLTISSTAGSGGGLRDYGVFRNEAVFTVYIPMTHSTTAAPAWTLQYALLRRPSANSSQVNLRANQASVRMGGQLLAPFPVDKENPEFPVEVVARNVSRLVVVYGEINAEGKVEKLRIVRSPSPLLNKAALEALERWTFRPAEMNGEPVAVKALFGIPLSPPR